MTNSAAISKLRALRKSVLADNKVEWEETSELLEFIRPLAPKFGFMFEEFEHLLIKTREDGEITKEESDKIAMHLDYLCGFFANRRLKAILGVVIVIALVIATAFVGMQIKAALGV